MSMKHYVNAAARIALALILGFTVFTVVSLQKSNHDVITKLKEDNSQQTVILCTLILSQNVQVSGQDAATIEKICKQKIEQNNEAISNAVNDGIQQQAAATGTPAVTSTTQSTTQATTTTNSPATPNVATSTTDTTPSPTPTPTPTPAPQPVRVLGVPVCVPDPLSLVKGGVCVTQ